MDANTEDVVRATFAVVWQLIERLEPVVPGIANDMQEWIETLARETSGDVRTPSTGRGMLVWAEKVRALRGLDSITSPPRLGGKPQK